MNAERSLGEFEQIVLLAILRLGDEAYGVSIITEIRARTGRNPSPGSLYTTLHRMEDKGLVTFREGNPTPERGGRSKRFLSVTHSGRGALVSAQFAYHSLLDGLDLLSASTTSRTLADGRTEVFRIAQWLRDSMPHISPPGSDFTESLQRGEYA